MNTCHGTSRPMKFYPPFVTPIDLPLCKWRSTARRSPGILQPALDRSSALVEVDVVEVAQLGGIQDSGRLNPA